MMARPASENRAQSRGRVPVVCFLRDSGLTLTEAAGGNE